MEVTLLGQNVSSYKSTVYEGKEKYSIENLCNTISKYQFETNKISNFIPTILMII